MSKPNISSLHAFGGFFTGVELRKWRYFCIFCVFKFGFPEEYEVGVKIPSSLLSPTNLKLSLNASAQPTLWSFSPSVFFWQCRGRSDKIELRWLTYSLADQLYLVGGGGWSEKLILLLCWTTYITSSSGLFFSDKKPFAVLYTALDYYLLISPIFCLWAV